MILKQIEIYIRERDGNREIRLPWIPEKISVKSGGTVRATYDIMNLGPTEIPTGSGLSAFSWKCTFPGKAQNTSLLHGSWQEPKNYVNIIEDWRKKRTPLKILVVGYPINHDVFLDDFSWEAVGGFGDIEYEISFIENRDLAVNKNITTQQQKRATSTSTTYTVKKGDNLWAIAAMSKYYGDGTKWEKIYTKNKDIIEKTAKKYGYANSDKGWWIFPGCVLTIPR